MFCNMLMFLPIVSDSTSSPTSSSSSSLHNNSLLPKQTTKKVSETATGTSGNPTTAINNISTTSSSSSSSFRFKYNNRGDDKDTDDDSITNTKQESRTKTKNKQVQDTEKSSYVDSWVQTGADCVGKTLPSHKAFLSSLHESSMTG